MSEDAANLNNSRYTSCSNDPSATQPFVPGILSEDKDIPAYDAENFEPHRSWLRWPLLFGYINAIMIVSAVSLCLSPATGKIAVAYQVPVVEVNMCGIIFTATFVPFTFVSIWMYKVMTTDLVLRISCVMMFVGGWCRMWADVDNHEFWPVLVG